MTFFDQAETVVTEAWTGNIIAQTGTSTTTTPGIINNYYRRYIVAFTYTSAELQAAFGKSSATISALRFTVSNAPTYQPYPSYAIGMKQGTFGSANPGSTGFTIVRSQASESFSVGTKTINFTTNFSWTGSDIAFVFAWGQCPTNYSTSGTTPIGSGNSYFNRTDAAGTYVINTDTFPTSQTNRPVMQLYG